MDRFKVNILLNIFQNLSQNDLVSVSEVCKKFYRVVNDFELIRHLILSPSIETDKVALTREYDSVTVRNYQFRMDRIPQFSTQKYSLLISPS